MTAYGFLCALFHDADRPRASDDEVAWYALRLPRDSGPLLQPMSGSGRLLLPLLQRGFNIHGADSSPAMLAHCEARLAAAGLTAPLVRQDIAALNLPFRYAAGFVAAGSFQLLADQTGARAALERLRAHLVPPGALLLDLVIPNFALHPPGAPIVEVRTVALADASRIALRTETYVDVASRRIDSRCRYERRVGANVVAREDEAIASTWYTEEEIVALLRDTGYCDVAVGPSPSPERADARGFSVTAYA